MALTAPLVAGRAIRKSFGETEVLRGVDLDVLPGEVHALVGANGAGKSTLVKILYGALRPDSGEVRGRTGPASVAYIPQDIQIVPHLPLTENLFLGHALRSARWLVDHAAQRRAAVTVIERVGIRHPAETLARDLSVAEQQLLMIGRALIRRVEVVILDEPTASLTPVEVGRLFALIRELRSSGVGLLYISHRLDEIPQIAGRVSVLRGGEVVFTSAAVTPKHELIHYMIGHDLPPAETRAAPTTLPAIDLRDGALPGRLRGISFRASTGEVLAFTGLIGSGRTSLARSLFGAEPAFSGDLRIYGKPARLDSPRAAIAHGLALLTENPKEQGLVLTADVATNISLPSAGLFSRFGWFDHRRERATAADYAARLDLQPLNVARLVRLLSGGNQQKVVIARWLLCGARVLLFDEPTRGIDIGAKDQVYAWIRRLAAEGNTVLLFTSEIEEALRLADRILVMRHGAISAELPAAEATEKKVLQAAF